MGQPLTAGIDSGRAMRFVAVACAVAAVLVVGTSIPAGHLHAGLPLGLGLLVGAGNGLAARRLFGLGAAFMATSLARLMLLTMLGFGIGFAFGLDRAWLVVLGIGIAQLVLAATAAWEVARG